METVKTLLLICFLIDSSCSVDDYHHQLSVCRANFPGCSCDSDEKQLICHCTIDSNPVLQQYFIRFKKKSYLRHFCILL